MPLGRRLWNALLAVLDWIFVGITQWTGSGVSSGASGTIGGPRDDARRWAAEGERPAAEDEPTPDLETRLERFRRAERAEREHRALEPDGNGEDRARGG